MLLTAGDSFPPVEDKHWLSSAIWDHPGSGILLHVVQQDKPANRPFLFCKKS